MNVHFGAAPLFGRLLGKLLLDFFYVLVEITALDRRGLYHTIGLSQPLPDQLEQCAPNLFGPLVCCSARAECAAIPRDC